MRFSHAFNPSGLPPLVSPRGPRPAVLWARLGSPWIDRQLSAGAVPWGSRARAARALQLTSSRRRRRLADALERLIAATERPLDPFRRGAVPPCRKQVREATPEILAIAGRLRSKAPIDAQGMARLRQLLSDGGGPCYMSLEPGALKDALESVTELLTVPD